MLYIAYLYLIKDSAYYKLIKVIHLVIFITYLYKRLNKNLRWLYKYDTNSDKEKY